jgi:quercetin dioxygenase-like cupin family protein
MGKPLIVSIDQAPQLKMVGEELTILASGAQTGSYEIFRQAGPEGAGPPPHHHDWDEAFYVVSGEVMFGVDDQQDLVARAGTLVHVPGGSMHWFRFGTAGGEMISVTSREGAAAFFTEVDREINPVDPDLPALVGIAASHQIDIPIPA